MPGSGRRSSPPRARPGLALLILPAALAAAVLVLPLAALLVRAPWTQLPRLLADPAVLESLGLSLGTALAATTISLLIGVPLGIVLAGSGTWPVLPRRLLRAVVTVPLVLPPVVGGIALLLLLGRRGVLGSVLAEAGIGIPNTAVAVVLSQVFVAMPFLVFAVEGAVSSIDRRTEAAAATLGASPGRVLRHITLPLVAPGVAAGAVLCFARALGEFGATITFAGSLPGVTRTLPIASYLALQSDPDAAIALALVLLAVAVAVLLLLRDRWLPGLRG